MGTTIFTHLAALNWSPGTLGQQLRSITNGQHRKASLYSRKIRIRCIGFVNAAGAAAQDHPFDVGVVDELLCLGKRMDLAIDVQLPHPACDQLRVLGTVVEYEDGFGQGRPCALWAASGGKSNGLRNAAFLHEPCPEGTTEHL